MAGLVVRISVCNADGSCVPVKTEVPVTVEGVNIHILSGDVQDLIDGIQAADDEVQSDD